MSLLPVPKNSLQNRLPPHPPNKAFDHNIKLCYSHTIVQGRKAIATLGRQLHQVHDTLVTPSFKAERLLRLVSFFSVVVSDLGHTIVQGRKAIATTFSATRHSRPSRSVTPSFKAERLLRHRKSLSTSLERSRSHHRSRPKGYCDLFRTHALDKGFQACHTIVQGRKAIATPG